MLSILSLPFNILAAPAPTREMTLHHNRRRPRRSTDFTAAFIKLTRESHHSERCNTKDAFVTQDYNFAIHGVNPGNVDILCIGTLS